MGSGPLFVVCTELIKPGVRNVQESALLEIGTGKPPASLEVAIQQITEDVAQCRVSFVSSTTPPRRVICVRLQRKVEGVKHTIREFVIGQTRTAVVFCRAIERRSNQPDVQEIVEVRCLQRGVLAVIGEAEQLLRPLRHTRIAAQSPNDLGRENRGGTGSSTLAKRGHARVIASSC